VPPKTLQNNQESFCLLTTVLILARLSYYYSFLGGTMNSNLPIDQQNVDEIKQTEEWLKDEECPKCHSNELFKTTTIYPNGLVSISIDCDNDDCNYYEDINNDE